MAARKPPFLTRIHVENFRSLRNVDIQLGSLNVLVGPNGAGKSNLLDVIQFLGDSVRSDISGALRARGGLDRVRYRGPSARSADVRISVEAVVTTNSSRNAPDEYELTFRGMRGRSHSRDEFLLVHRSERFLFKRTAGRGRRITLEGQDLQVYDDNELEFDLDLSEGTLALATLPKLGSQAGGREVEAIANLFGSFRVFSVDVEAVRNSVARDGASGVLENDASNLASFLWYLNERHPDTFATLLHDAKHFIPGLEDVQLLPVGGASDGRYVALAERGLIGITPLSDASFGSVRALALLALLYDPNPPKLTCIEEIDHGLHPHVLDRLVDLIRSASDKTQLIVATHSPSLVNRLSPDELVVCERREDGSSAIPAIDSAVVREMELAADGELGLGELWFSGVLGGVPE